MPMQHNIIILLCDISVKFLMKCQQHYKNDYSNNSYKLVEVLQFTKVIRKLTVN